MPFIAIVLTNGPRPKERKEVMNEVTYEIKEQYGVITAHSTGWNKELNKVSWNGGAPKFDIRDWSPDHKQMGRGITLHEAEMKKVVDMVTRGRL